MDKNHFLESAPKYYALALIEYFEYRDVAQFADIQESYQDVDENGEVVLDRIKHLALFKVAVDFLIKEQALELVKDDFGPDLLRKSNNFDMAYRSLQDRKIEPFFKYSRLERGDTQWLHAALEKIDATCRELGIVDEDFRGNNDREWAPLPLDRSSADYQDAVDRLESSISQIEQDNGYAANVPEERSYVLSSLKATLDRLKKDSAVSIGFLRKHAFDPLAAVAQRFGKAALGIAARGAAAAILKLVETAETAAIIQLIKSYFHLP